MRGQRKIAETGPMIGEASLLSKPLSEAYEKGRKDMQVDFPY